MKRINVDEKLKPVFASLIFVGLIIMVFVLSAVVQK